MKTRKASGKKRKNPSPKNGKKKKAKKVVRKKFKFSDKPISDLQVKEMHDLLLLLGVDRKYLTRKKDLIKYCAIYNEDVVEGWNNIRQFIDDLNQDELPAGNDRQEPTFVSRFPEGRELLSSEIKARKEVVKLLVDSGILPSKAQLEDIMDPDVVVFLTGFPVDTSLAVLGFIRNLCNVQGNSFAASMPPLIAAMISLKRSGLKVIHLDILNKAFKWNKCKEKDPWSDHEEGMKDFAQRIMDCGFASIFSAGHLATDRLRKHKSQEDGIFCELFHDRHAFTLSNDAKTLVFTGCHPQNLLKTSTGAACINAGNWDRSMDCLVHYMRGKFQPGVGPVFQFVSRCEGFPWTETAKDFAKQVRAIELNRGEAFPYEHLPDALKGALVIEGYSNQEACDEYKDYGKDAKAQNFVSAVTVLVSIYGRRGGLVGAASEGYDPISGNSIRMMKLGAHRSTSASLQAPFVLCRHNGNESKVQLTVSQTHGLMITLSSAVVKKLGIQGVPLRSDGRFMRQIFFFDSEGDEVELVEIKRITGSQPIIKHLAENYGQVVWAGFKLRSSERENKDKKKAFEEISITLANVEKSDDEENETKEERSVGSDVLEGSKITVTWEDGTFPCVVRCNGSDLEVVSANDAFPGTFGFNPDLDDWVFTPGVKQPVGGRFADDEGTVPGGDDDQF
ncbi:hypothetical protein TrCOL_g9183, partial [Triparma columacea]